MAVETLAHIRMPDHSTAMDKLIDATHEGMEAVNSLILSRYQSDVSMVPEIAKHLIDSGGKRLRPMLTLAASTLFTELNDNAVRFAAAVEFMHNATLLHDDVVDESDMRRGRPAARKIWGNQASVLVGDFLLGQAFMMMVESRDLDALGVLSKAAAVIAEGEVFQLAMAGNADAQLSDYEKIIHSKTATLFEAATQVGAMASGASAVERDALAFYGHELGMAFQLIDDVLDYGGASGTLGKNTGDDLREGKMTMPIILSLQQGNAAEKATVLAALGNANSGDDKVAAVLAIFRKYGSLEATVAKAEAHAEAARNALKQITPSHTRDIMMEIPEFCTSRAY